MSRVRPEGSGAFPLPIVQTLPNVLQRLEMLRGTQLTAQRAHAEMRHAGGSPRLDEAQPLLVRPAVDADAEAIAPNVAVPTTAGTGSEVGRAGVLTNTETHVKKIIFHPKIEVN